MEQYIVFDLEATCWSREQTDENLHEIIEIGAVKLDENMNQLDVFQTFVKPKENPDLSDFCMELTSIRQSDVDYAPLFAEALIEFEQWINHKDEDITLLLSWGHYDKTQLTRECEAKGYQGKIIDLLESHHSLKHEFAELRNTKPCGMEKALRILGLPLEGTHHRGIDDALNISNIFRSVYDEWKDAQNK